MIICYQLYVMYGFIYAIFNYMMLRFDFIRTSWIFSVLLVVTLSSITYAHSTSQTSSKTVYLDTVIQAIDFEEIFVIGFIHNQRLLDTPGAIQILDPADFSAQDLHSLRGALEKVSGLRFEERAPASYRIALRGSSLRAPFGIRNVKIYWNDFPITEPTGSTFLNLLDPIQFREAEVLKGPSGSLYGAGNGGVLLFRSFPLLSETTSHKPNISTQETTSESSTLETKWSRVTIQNQTEVGAFGRQILGSRILQEDQHSQIGLQWAQSQLDGYRKQSAMNRSILEFNGRFRVLETAQTLSAHVVHSDLVYEIPGGLNATQFQDDPRQARPGNRFVLGSEDAQAGINHEAILAGVHWDWALTKKWDQKISLFGSSSSFENPFNLDYKVDNRISGGFRGLWSWKSKSSKLSESRLRWDTGIEFHRAAYDARNYGNNMGIVDTLNFDDRIALHQLLVFSSVQWQINPSLRIHFAQSVNDLQYSIDRLFAAYGYGNTGTIDRTFNLQWIPRIGLNYRLNTELTTHLSLARGFSPPTLEEIRTNEGTVNTGLEAEIGTNVEWGVRAYLFNKRWFIDGSLFYFWLKDAIVQQQTQRGTLIFLNAGETTQPGAELRIEGSIWELDYIFAGSYYPFEFKSYQNNRGVFDGNAITGVPKTQLLHQLSAELPAGIELQLSHQYQSELPLDDANTVFADAHHLLRAQMSWEYQWSASLLSRIYLAIDNLTNSSYSLGYDTNAFGGRYYQPAAMRHGYAGIQLKWSLKAIGSD